MSIELKPEDGEKVCVGCGAWYVPPARHQDRKGGLCSDCRSRGDRQMDTFLAGCNKCFDQPWRRPKDKPCRCGESYVAQASFKAVASAGLQSCEYYA